MKKYSFGKNERMRGKKNISRLFADGKYFFLGSTQITAIKIESHRPNIEIGISVPKKNIPKAVDRNLIKRRLKESIRIQKHLLTEEMKNSNYTLQVFFIWQSKKIPSSEFCSMEINSVLNKISSKIDSIPTK